MCIIFIEKKNWKRLYHRCFTSHETSEISAWKVKRNYDVDADVDVNGDADTEMPMPRFPNGWPKCYGN